MAKMLMIAWLVLGVFAQEPPEFPAGWFCSPRGIVKNGKQTAEHPCHCKNMGDPDTSCETRATNDQACTQWCHEAKCACPVSCEVPKK